MLNIRLARTGRKRDAHFRVVVSDSAHGRVGRILETVGDYHPRMPNDAEGRIRLDRARARYWLDRGARPSDTVRSFLKNLPEPSAEDAPPAAEPAEPAEAPAETAPETPSAEAASSGTPSEAASETASEPAPESTPESAPESNPEPAAG